MVLPPEELRKPLTDLLLSVADDKFILGHRNSDWTGLAPILEEDIAFSSLAQDEISHAAALYDMTAKWLGTTADALAYGRKPEEYRCAAIVEIPDDFDWAVALARRFFCDHFDILRLQRLGRSSYPPLAALALRLAAEEQIHVQHADSWVKRLGRGNEDSRRRVQAALDKLTPPALQLFEPTADVEKLETAGLYPPLEADMFETWAAALQAVATEAGLNPKLTKPRGDAPGGRRGRRHEAFGPLLDELCEVYRAEPQAQW